MTRPAKIAVGRVARSGASAGEAATLLAAVLIASAALRVAPGGRRR